MQDGCVVVPVVFYDLIELPPSNLDFSNVILTYGFADRHIRRSAHSPECFAFVPSNQKGSVR